MKALKLLTTVAGAILLGAALSGCHSGTESSLSPQEKADFGHAGMPPPTQAQLQAAYKNAPSNVPGPGGTAPGNGTK